MKLGSGLGLRVSPLTIPEREGAVTDRSNGVTENGRLCIYSNIKSDTYLRMALVSDVRSQTKCHRPLKREEGNT